MPLAFSDESLARLAIAATAIAPAERKAWLLKFAERIDPPSSRCAQRAEVR